MFGCTLWCLLTFEQDVNAQCSLVYVMQNVLLCVTGCCSAMNGDTSMQSAASSNAVSPPHHFIVEKELSDVRGDADARVQVLPQFVSQPVAVCLGCEETSSHNVLWMFDCQTEIFSLLRAVHHTRTSHTAWCASHTKDYGQD